MAKISVSLPDALKEQLDQYVEEHGGSVSQTVQDALEAYFSGQPPPGTPSGELALLEQTVAETRADVKRALHELTRTQYALEQHRQCLLVVENFTEMGGFHLPVPPPLVS